MSRAARTRLARRRVASPGGAARAPLLALTALLALASAARGQITRIDLEVVESPALEGRAFGTVGAYERLRGVFYGEVDPADPRNATIADLDLAPRNARGKVEYATTVEIYRPIDMSRWNRAIYHTVPNRGGAGAAPAALLERGFALVRVGWQGDIPPTGSNVVAMLPVARNPDGTPVTGPALEEWIFDDDARTSVASLSYEAASLDESRAKLTVRHTQESPRETPADLRWSFLNERQVRIERPAGFDGGAIYELVYEAKNPIVMGLGFAAMRDAISFLRYETADPEGEPNPLAYDGLPEVVLSLGISQSGRYLRDFLYRGFNEDVRGRIVFDGMHPDIAGSRKTFTSFRFSQPGRWQKQHEDHLYPGDQFPFTYVTLHDPISGRTDGLLERCSRSGTCPKIVHTDGEAEIWQARSSLVVTDPLGRDVALPDNVRVYLMAGTQHGGGAGVYAATPRAGICQNPSNPMNLSAIRTALTVALYEWAAHGVEPPPSRFPTVGNGGLVDPKHLRFPAIPGVLYTGSVNGLRLHDHGTLPPREGEAYTVLVGAVDADGNMTHGVRHPHLQVPIGTFTGWNLRRDGFGEDDQCGGTGSFIPFPATRAERLASGDPRASLEERYPTHDAYVRAVAHAADQLVRERLLLPEDAVEIVRLAEQTGVRR
ncbi:MAG TPA: alpha/beta hydrolase domain-containing protein [Longimicrobiales bacterium]|nr:alpha/beta hydrolase domain-containing protein [Longimicrobiales bacterium]